MKTTALRVRLAAVAACVSLLLWVSGALAQSPTGSISGTVLDSTGAALPGANVTATNTATGVARGTTSGRTGVFTFPLLPVGLYAVGAEISGFAPRKIANVNVAIGTDTTVKLTMEPAGVAAAVTVSGEAPLIETTRSEQASVVSERMVANLPTNGRSFLDFTLTTPGVVRDVRGGDLSFAGQRGTSNSLVVDGADNNNTFFGQTTGRTGVRSPYQFSQDAVKEFQVNRNAYSAEYGRAGGAVINVVTKSGTNEYHGNGFYFYRDKALNAKDYIDSISHNPKAPYHFDQFGASVGGPVLKDQLFFFANYDGQRNTVPNTVVLTIPSGTPTDANTLAGIAKLQGQAASWNRNLNQDIALLKADWEAAAASHLSVRYNHQNFDGVGFENGGIQNSLEHTGDSLIKSDTVAASFTASLTPAAFNELRGQWSRDSEPGTANNANPEGVVRQNGQQVLLVGRNSFSPRETTINRYQVADTVTYLLGDHAIKGGVDFNKDNILNFFPGNFFGSYTFASIANYNLGIPSSYTQAFPGPGTTGPTTHPDLTDYAVFLQDEWRATPKLTVNLGLRYDYNHIKQPTTINPDPQLLAAGLLTNRFHEDTNNIAPRLGIAFTPTDRTVVRAGYGIFYARTPSILYTTATSSNGINVQILTFTTNVPTYPAVFPSIPTGATIPKPTIFVLDPQWQNPRVQQASFGVEQGVTNDIAVNLSYLWVKGTNLPRSADINEANPTLVTTPIVDAHGNPLGTATYTRYSSTRPFTNFARIIEFQSNAESEYNGGTLEILKRFSDNWTARISYTYSHVIDTKPDATAVVPFSAGDDAKYIQDPLNPAGDRADGENDVRHRVVLSGFWAPSFGPGPLLSGWSFSGIVTFQTGQPYTPVGNADLNNDQNSRSDRAPGFARNSFRYPSFFSVDPRISKRFDFGPVGLELIAEAFNVFNNHNVIGVRTTYYSLTNGNLVLLNDPKTGFGTATLSAGPRILQLAAKVSF
jgi:outer membrane receptor protein involved in Fe transport